MSDQRALEGIKVLDFTQVLAGPFATQQMAQLGADVIKIEQPGTGDITRGLMSATSDSFGPSFLTCNLGKRSLALDLKHPDSRPVIEALIRRSDVVVENFKPGTIEKLGYGYEAVRAIKPDVVYASVSGYGQQGPKAELPAYDGAIQAASGMMSVTGHAATGPTRAGYFAVDMSTALNAAFAITAALLRRQMTGEGQRIDVAMMDTATVLVGPQMSNHLVTGNLPDLLGNASPTKQPTSNVFATQDGHIQVIAMQETHVRKLLERLGHGELYEQYSDPVVRVEKADEINALLVPAFKSNTTEYWLAEMKALALPTAPIRNLAQSAADEQNNTRLIFTEVDVPERGPTKVVSAGHLAHPAPPKVDRPPPGLGEHNEEILTELGFSQAEIHALREKQVL